MCRVIDLSHDQDSTDLMKCLLCAKHELERRGNVCHAGMTILVLGASCPCSVHAKLANKQSRWQLAHNRRIWWQAGSQSWQLEHTGGSPGPRHWAIASRYACSA